MKKKLLLGAVMCLLGSSAVASDEEPTQSIMQSRTKQFVIVAGGSSVLFDSSFRFLNKETGNSIFLDPEGQLDLPQRQNVPTLTMLVALKDRHFLSIGATQFRRESEPLLVEDVHLGDLEIIDASVEVWLNSNDFDISYGYKLFADDHIRILGKVGFYTLDLDVGIEAEGHWSYGGVPGDGLYEQARTLIAPLPLIGVQFNFYVNRRWSLALAVDGMYLPIGDITGRALRSKIHTRYAFGKTVGIIFGIDYFNISVTEQNDERKYEVKYGYDGVFAGLIFAF